MLDNIFTEIISTGVKLGIEDKYLALLIFMAISFGVNLFYIFLKEKHSSILISLWLFAGSVIAVLGYGFYAEIEQEVVTQNSNTIQILEFKSLKESYNATDNIAFKIRSNKDAYYYLYTEKAGTGKMIPLKGDENNMLKANTSKNIGYYKIREFVGDERVILTITSKPYSKFEQALDRVSYTKELGYIGSLPQDLSSDDTKPMEVASREIFIKINKEQHGVDVPSLPDAAIEIHTESNTYKLGEEIDFDIKTTREGYVTVFEATPILNVKRLKSNDTYRLTHRSFTIGKMPIGEHIAIAIYTDKNEHIQADDFDISKKDTKAGAKYELVFHNGKSYIYDIEDFEIRAS